MTDSGNDCAAGSCLHKARRSSHIRQPVAFTRLQNAAPPSPKVENAYSGGIGFCFVSQQQTAAMMDLQGEDSAHVLLFLLWSSSEGAFVV
jgi:hypothetical protein